MLVVDSLVPDGPADKHLKPGDVLIRMNGEVQLFSNDCNAISHYGVLT